MPFERLYASGRRLSWVQNLPRPLKTRAQTAAPSSNISSSRSLTNCSREAITQTIRETRQDEQILAYDLGAPQLLQTFVSYAAGSPTTFPARRNQSSNRGASAISSASRTALP